MSSAVLHHRIKMDSGARATSKASASFWFLLAVLGQFIFAITIAFFYGLTALRVDPQVWLQNLPNPFAAGNVMGDAVLAGLILCATAMTVAGALYLISRVRDAR